MTLFSKYSTMRLQNVAAGVNLAGCISASELSIFLAQKIPAVTLGITRGSNYQHDNSRVKIDPIFTGIAQVIGVLQAIDNGVCDG